MKTETQRLLKLIEADRGEIKPDCSAAAREEFMRIAEEFFETDGEGVLNVERGKRDLRVTFTVKAKRVKNFTALK